MTSLRALAVFCACLAAAGHACALPQAASAAAADLAARPRIALVLSGGGARGLAHIGVLRVLRELRVPVDIVVGTSMGSVIGGAYAAGASVADLERMALHTDWDRVIADRPPRDDLMFRRREEDVLLPSRIEFGVHRDGISLPPAAAGNAALEQVLGELLPAGTRDKPVNELALPFRSVASDLVSGELVDLADTPLFLTMRASLAVPGVFAPVRVKQRLVVDGGLVRNLPVDLARAMGAEIVIAVNVGTPLAPEKELGSAVGVAQQMLNILTEQNVQRSLKELRPDDILLAPEMNGISFLDFKQAERAMRAGERAAHALAARLAPLALPAERYALFESRRLAAPPLADAGLPLARLEVHSEGDINPQALKVQSGLVVGRKVTLEQVREAGERLYGRGDLERVETEVSDAAGQRSVLIKANEAEWASSRLRVGLELASDFDDANSFALKLMHVRTSINPWGAELRTVMGIGDKRDFAIQFWQPLGPGSSWYVAPSAQYGSFSSDLFSMGRRAARVGHSGYAASMVLGRELGTWGDLQAGLTRQRASLRVVVPENPERPVERALDTTLFVRYRVDTLDSLGFPSRGFLVDAAFEHSSGDGRAGPSLARSSVLAMSAFHSEAWAGHVYGEFARAQRGSAPLSLGGFLRLSGTPTDALEGRKTAFARLVMARRVGVLPVTLGGTVRAGFSFELGGGFDRELPLRGKALKQAASAFLSVDTRFGPTYLGAGATKDGNRALYIFLGPIW